MSWIFVVLAAFLASAVETVEALTIVLALGVTRGWRSVRIGTAAALVALALLVAGLGPGLRLVPVDALRLVVGAFLLIFGMQWLRKAILRAGGRIPLHNEEVIYSRQVRMAGATAVPPGMDWYAFTVSFKGVFLEGIEVVFIVLTFGSAHGSLPLASLGAAAAVLLVSAAGALVHRPLSRVPENAMKFAVGALLTTFGIFWAGEGAGVTWPGSDGALPAILAFIVLYSLVLVRWLRRDWAGRPGVPDTAVRRGD